MRDNCNPVTSQPVLVSHPFFVKKVGENLELMAGSSGGAEFATEERDSPC
jgi:hypothetical protein